MKVDKNTITADEGKIFRRKSDEMVLGTILTLGINDSIDNYEEVEIEEVEETEK